MPPRPTIPTIPRNVLAAHVMPRLNNRTLRSWAATSRAGLQNARTITAERRRQRADELRMLAQWMSPLTLPTRDPYPHILKDFMERKAREPAGRFRLLRSSLTTANNGVTKYAFGMKTTHITAAAILIRTGQAAGAPTTFGVVFGLIGPDHRSHITVTAARAEGGPLVVDAAPDPGFPRYLTKVVESAMLGRRRSPRTARPRST